MAERNSSWIETRKDGVILHIVARPGASRRKIVRIDPHGVVIALNSPPEDGRANAELAGYVAKIARVAQSAIVILHGTRSRNKLVSVKTDDPTRVAAALRVEVETALK